MRLFEFGLPWLRLLAVALYQRPSGLVLAFWPWRPRRAFLVAVAPGLAVALVAPWSLRRAMLARAERRAAARFLAGLR